MKKLVFFVILLLTWSHTTLAEQLQKAKPAEYRGAGIDLTNRHLATLYRGNGELVATHLNVVGISELVEKESAVWQIELPFKIAGEQWQKHDIWLSLRTNISAARVSLNDTLLFENGAVGDNQAERAGNSLVLHQLPDRLLNPSVNHLDIRFSNKQNPKASIFRDVSIGPIEEFHHQRLVMSLAPLIFFGVFLLLVLVNFGLYFSMKAKTFLIQSGFFALNAGLMLIEVLYWNAWLGTDSFLDSYQIRFYLSWLIFLCLLWIVHIELHLSNKLFYLLLSIGVVALFVDRLYLSGLILLVSLLPFFYVVSSFKKLNKSHCWLVIGLVIVATSKIADEWNLLESYVWVYNNVLINSLVFKLDNLAVVLLSVSLIYSASRRIFKKISALTEAEIKLQDLKFQLTTKTIQPHFLMNALMSLQQLIDNKDPIAGSMVEALSDEFSEFQRVAKKDLINIREEVALCNNFLAIMNMQQGAEHKLTVNGFNGKERIPPAIIHTLVENGITHGVSGRQSADFTLSKSISEQQTIITLTSSEPSKCQTECVPGTGIRYIKSRLQVWKPDLWQFYAHPSETGWQTVIKVSGEL